MAELVSHQITSGGEIADKRILRIEDAHKNACAEAVAEDVSLTEKKRVI